MAAAWFGGLGIQAESHGAGQGSTFTVKFPRSPVPPSRPAGADRSVGLKEAPDLTGIRVLIVEDDDDARALDLLAKERLDVLLSDIEMPGTHGYRLIRELHLPKPVQAAELITGVASLATRGR